MMVLEVSVTMPVKKKYHLAGFPGHISTSFTEIKPPPYLHALQCFKLDCVGSRMFFLLICDC